MTTVTEVFPSFFPQLLGKCQDKTRKDGARPALFLTFVLFYVLFVCKCVLYYCHRVAIQLQLTKYIYLNTVQKVGSESLCIQCTEDSAETAFSIIIYPNANYWHK